MVQAKSSHRFEFLDGLRGIAALAVIFFHFNGTLKDHGILHIPHFIDTLCQWGHYGVQLFFVLSGFVIAYSLRNEQISSLFCLRFFLKRSIRLDPPYWLVIGLMLMLNCLANFLFHKGGEYLATFSQILLNVLYLPDLLQIPRILPVAWTLCIEIQFYLTFVLLLQFYQFLKRRLCSKSITFFDQSALFHILFSSLTLFSLLQNTSWAPLPSLPGIFIRYWYSFFMGCLTCWTMLLFVRPTFLWISFLLLGSYSLIDKNPEAFATFIIALVIYIVARMKKMHHVLTTRFFQYAGKISYSLYLIHWPIGMKFIDISLRFFNSEIHLWLIFILTIFALILTFLVAHYFYYFIELPSLNLSRKVIGVPRENHLKLRPLEE